MPDQEMEHAHQQQQLSEDSPDQAVESYYGVMETVRPLKYSDLPETTFVELSGMEFQVKQETQVRKTWGLFNKGLWANITLRDLDQDLDVTFEYELPADLKVGDELDEVERGIYRLIEETHHTARQLRAVALDRQRIESLESQDAWVNSPITEKEIALNLALNIQAESKGRPWEDEFLERIILAVRYVTKISSISVAGYADFLQSKMKRRKGAVKAPNKESTALVGSSSQKVAVRGETRTQPVPGSTAELLEGVLGVIEVESYHRNKIHGAKLAVLDFLDAWSAGRETWPSAKAVDILVDSFTPAYMRIKRRMAVRRRLPKSWFGHLVKSVFLGGIAGEMVTSLIGSPFGMGFPMLRPYIDGWSIGASVVFFWPFVRAGYYHFHLANKPNSPDAMLIRNSNSALDALPEDVEPKFIERIRQRRRDLLTASANN